MICIYSWLFLLLDIILGLFAILTIYSSILVTLIILKKVHYYLPEWFKRKWRILVIINLIICIFDMRLIHGHSDVLWLCLITSALFIVFHIYLLFSIYTSKRNNSVKQ